MTDEPCQVVIPAAFSPREAGAESSAFVQKSLDPGFRRDHGMLVMSFVELNRCLEDNIIVAIGDDWVLTRHAARAWLAESM